MFNQPFLGKILLHKNQNRYAEERYYSTLIQYADVINSLIKSSILSQCTTTSFEGRFYRYVLTPQTPS